MILFLKNYHNMIYRESLIVIKIYNNFTFEYYNVREQ